MSEEPLNFKKFCKKSQFFEIKQFLIYIQLEINRENKSFCDTFDQLGFQSQKQKHLIGLSHWIFDQSSFVEIQLGRIWTMHNIFF